MNKTDIEALFICGMIFWFVPFALSLPQYPNFDIVGAICILMFTVSILGSGLFSLDIL